MKTLTIFVDGGSRGNPGPGGIGVVIFDNKNKRIKDFSKYLGIVTNNVAEYTAVVYGLEEALILGATDVRLNLDSELVAEQLKGSYRVRDNDLRPLFEQVLHIMGGFKKVDIVHIDRRENKEADRLVNKAINLASLI